MGFFRYVPFVGQLPDCSWNDLKDAFVEVLIATAFSTMPIWFLPVLGQAIFTVPISSNDAVRTGEYFLFSAALVGPLIYIITKTYGERDDAPKTPFMRYKIHFPFGSWFVFVSVGICLLSSVAFTILRNPLFKQTELAKIINYNGVITASWVTFIVATVIFFCATAYRNSLEHITDRLPNQERDFVNQWENSK